MLIEVIKLNIFHCWLINEYKINHKYKFVTSVKRVDAFYKVKVVGYVVDDWLKVNCRLECHTSKRIFILDDNQSVMVFNFCMCGSRRLIFRLYLFIIQRICHLFVDDQPVSLLLYYPMKILKVYNKSAIWCQCWFKLLVSLSFLYGRLGLLIKIVYY